MSLLKILDLRTKTDKKNCHSRWYYRCCRAPLTGKLGSGHKVSPGGGWRKFPNFRKNFRSPPNASKKISRPPRQLVEIFAAPPSVVQNFRGPPRGSKKFSWPPSIINSKILQIFEKA